MHAIARIHAATLLVFAAAFLGGCESASQKSGTSVSESSSEQTATMSVKKQPSTWSVKKQPSTWYAGKVKDDFGEHDFWWCQSVDEKGASYTLIAGALDSLPSSAPGKGGIEAPQRNEQSPDPILIDFCKADGQQKKETHTLRNGFLCAIVEPSTTSSTEAEGTTTLHRMLLPWPIIIRTPAHPAGTFAGTFVLLTIQEPKDAILRESVFRPNLGDNIPCERWPLPDGDNSKRLVHVTGGCCGDEYQFFLREVAGVNNVKGEVHQDKIDPASPEAMFLVDTCTFVQKAREVIAATDDPGEPLKLPCKP